MSPKLALASLAGWTKQRGKCREIDAPTPDQDRRSNLNALKRNVNFDNPKSLVARSAIVNQRRIQYELDTKEKGEGIKRRQVLTTHGFLYIARWIKALEQCGTAGRACMRRGCNNDPNHCQDRAKRLCREIQDMTPAILNDLSKQDLIARLLFVCQAIWMVVQLSARYCTHLPITILELHAAAHVTIATVHYLVWWNKPIDVFIMTPITMSTEEEEEMHGQSTEDTTNHLRIDPDSLSLLSSVKASERQPIPAGRKTHPAFESIQQAWSHLLEAENETSSKAYFTSQATLGKEGYQQITGHQSIKLNNPFTGIVRALRHIILSWQQWPAKAFTWFFVVLFYGGIHFAAWDWHFPSVAERSLFNFCTAYTTASIALLTFLAILAYIYRFLRVTAKKLKNASETERLPFGKLGLFVCRLYIGFARSDILVFLLRNGVRLTGLGIAIGSIPWLCARLFMFVEAIISIRDVPELTYENVRWTAFIPHI